jgi:hypothetical protein
MLFKFIAGSNFHPRESTTTNQYAGAGCLYRNTSSGFFVSDLQLPQDAVVDFLRVYFDDSNDANDVTAYLYSYDAQGAFTQVAMAKSNGSGGYSSAGSGFFSYTVDNVGGALGLVVGMDAANDSTIKFCGVRLRYTIDVPSYVMLPAILKQYMGE